MGNAYYTGMAWLRCSGILTVVHAVAAYTSFCEQPGYSTVFVDEFDGALNTSNWHVVDQAPRDNARCRDMVTAPNSKWWLAHCTRLGVSKAQQVSIQDGALVIRADAVRVRDSDTSFANITTGGVTSKRSWGGNAAPGPTRICLNAMLPGSGGNGVGQGFWPALWMMPDDSSCWACNGEIDIVEMINGDGSVQSHYHYSTNATWCEMNAKVGCTLKNGGKPSAGTCICCIRQIALICP